MILLAQPLDLTLVVQHNTEPLPISNSTQANLSGKIFQERSFF